MWISSSLLLLALSAPIVAADLVVVQATGSVVVDSGATKPLNAPAKDLMLSWAVADGCVVQAGDAVFRFDPALILPQLEDRLRAAAIAQMEQDRLVAQRQAETEGMESERRILRADLAVVRASLALAEAADPQVLAVLRADVVAAELAADVARREAERSQVERDQGRISQSAATAAIRQQEEARLAVAGPALRLDLAEQPREVPVDLAGLRLRARELAVRLGLNEQDLEDPAIGIGARIVAAKAQIEADLAARRSDLERSEAELQQSRRDIQDHTPLVSIEVRADGSEIPMLRLRFAPTGRNAAEGWVTDQGRLVTDGQGWDRALQASELAWRAPVAGASSGEGKSGGQRPAGKGGGGGKGGRKPGGGPPSGMFTGGVVLLASPAIWSMRLPNGKYTVIVNLGDDREWDGPMVRVEGQPLAFPGRVGPGLHEQRVTVAVADGRLDVAVADREIKTLRAPAAGIVVLQQHAKAGLKINDPSWTLGFLASPEAFMVDALVAQELAPLLAPQRVQGAPDTPLADRIMLAGVDLVGHNGHRIPGKVVSVGAQSVRYLRGDREWGGGNPADNTARELRVCPITVSTMPLAQGESMVVELRFTRPDGTTVLPPHLVRMDRDGAVIRRRNSTVDETVQAVRLGGEVVVDARLDAAQLVPPPPRKTGPLADAAGRFRGEVAPGARTRVSLSWIWGKVESMIEDGRIVAVGDTVLTVYNPQMDANKPRLERERRAAVQRILAGAERRKQDHVRAQAEHEARIIAESQARLRLRRLRDADVISERDASEAVRRAISGQTVANEQIARLARLSVPDSQDLAAATVAHDRAVLDLARAQLGAAAYELRIDWLESQNLSGTWVDQVVALSRRDAELAEAAVQERINTLSDRIAMENVAEGDWWQRNFATRRVLKAPVAGRILFQTGWNDQVQRSEKIAKEFPVWGGMTVAEIVDESALRFIAELPEERFPSLRIGSTCEIEFESAPGQPVTATLIDLGRAFTLPRDRIFADDAKETVTSRRAFTVVAAFTPPEALRRNLPTGAKGWIRLP